MILLFRNNSPKLILKKDVLGGITRTGLKTVVIFFSSNVICKEKYNNNTYSFSSKDFLEILAFDCLQQNINIYMTINLALEKNTLLDMI